MLQNLCARPIVEYASVAWDPVGGGNQQLRHQIEMVQRRASRFVTGDWRTTSSVSAMIDTLQWQTLEQRRLQSRLIFLHKYCYKAIHIKEPIAIRARNLNTNYQAIHSRLRCYENSFAPATVRDWNALHPDIRNEAEIIKFTSETNATGKLKHTSNFAENDYLMSMQIYILI